MDHLFRTLVDWIEIASITGDEADYADALCRHLEGLGFACERQPVADGRFNVLARSGRPEVVFCTHLDTVPPFIPSRVDSDFVHGRGACDAKGQALAMLCAAERLLREGEDRVGVLFTVGEEVDSIGATEADARLAEPWAPRYTIIGEPTDSTFVRAAKGLFKARLCARGVAGHSSQDVGPSAVHELVSCVHHMLAEPWGKHALLGAGSLNIGEIRGGVAANVVADSASAEILVRTVESPEAVETRLASCCNANVQLERVAKAYGPVEFEVPEGQPSQTVAFGTDAPHLPRWGTPLLFGAGSILDAHTDHEKIEKGDLVAAVETYVDTVRNLLAREDARA